MKLHLPKALIAALASVYTLAAPLATTLATGTLLFATTSPLYAEGEGNESATPGEDEEVTVSPNIPADATITWTTATATEVTLAAGAPCKLYSTTNGGVIKIIGGTNSGNNNPYVIGNNGAYTGDLWIDVTGAALSNRLTTLYQATATVMTGNAYIRFTSDYTGTGTWKSIIGAHANSNSNAKINGNVYMEFASSSLNVGATGTLPAVGGAYNGAITGTSTMVFKAGTFSGTVYGGNSAGDYNVGGTNVQISGGTFNANVYAGSAAGAVGSTQLTFFGNNFSIGSAVSLITSGGSNSGTVTNDTTMTICDMDGTASGGLANYEGTLSGDGGAGVGGTKYLRFINSNHDNFGASLENFDTITLENSTLTVSSLGGASLIVADAASTLTISSSDSITGNISLTGKGSYAINEFGALAATITNSSNLTISGSIGITDEVNRGDMYAVATGNFETTEGVSSTSGYAVKDYYIIKANGGTLTVSDGTSFADGITRNGNDVYFTASDSSVYYVNEAMNYATGSDVYNVGSGQTILVCDGGSLKLTGALTNNSITLKTQDSGVVYLNNGLVENAALTSSSTISSLGTSPGQISLAVQTGDKASMWYSLASTIGSITVEQGATLAIAKSFTDHSNLDISNLSGNGTVQLVHGVESNTGAGHRVVNSGSFYGTLQFVASNKHKQYLDFNDAGTQSLTSTVNGEDKYISLDVNGEVDRVVVNLTDYNDTNGALKMGSLTGNQYAQISGSNSTTNAFNYLELHQDTDTEFAGKFNSDGAKSVGIIKCGEGTLTLSGTNASTADLRVKEGQVTVSGAWAGDVSVDAGAILTYSGSGKTLGNGTFAKSETEGVADALLKIDDGASLTINGTVSAQKVQLGTGASLTFAAGSATTIAQDVVVQSGNTVTANESTLGSFILHEGGNLSIASDKLIGGLTTVATEGAAGVTAFNLGNGVGTTVGVNSLTVAENTSLAVTGNLKIASTITLNGTLTLQGDFYADSLANLDQVAGSGCYDRLSGDTKNGYEQAVYALYKGDGAFSYVLGAGETEPAQRYINVQNLDEQGQIRYTQYEIDNLGQVRVGESSGRYMVNEGVVVYGATDNLAAAETTSVIVLNGGTLELAEDFASSLSLAKDSNLKLNEGTMIGYSQLPTATDPSVKLTVNGSGTINLGSNLVFDNANLVLGEDWTGNIRVAGATFGTQNNNVITLLNNIQSGNGWVELVACSGRLPSANSDISANIRLTGESALKVTSGSWQQTHTFSGNIAGDGELRIETASAAGNNTLQFTGDVSAWDGSFNFVSCNVADNVRTFNLFFSGTGELNADMKISSGTTTATSTKVLNVEIAGTGNRTINSAFSVEDAQYQSIKLNLSGDSVKTFAGDVEVASVTSKSTANSTFDKALTTGTLNVGQGSTAGKVTIGATGVANVGNATVTSGSTLAINGTATVTDTLTNSGTLTFANGSATTLNNLIINTGSTTTFAANSTTTINGTLTTNAELTIANGTIASTTGLTKTGSGTLTIENAVDLQLSGLTISQGTVKLKTLQSNETAVKLGAVTMNVGTTLEQHSNPSTSNYSHRQVRLESLTVTGTSTGTATLQGTQHNCYFSIGDLTLGGNTLNIKPMASSTAWANVLFNGEQSSADAVSSVELSSQRYVLVSIANDRALQKSTLTLNNPTNNDYQDSALAIATDNAHVLGVTGGNAWKLTSTANLTQGTGANNANNLSGDSTVRTLTITGTGTYTFAGKVGANLNLVMDGTGSQTFSGTLTNVNGTITANNGTLTLGGNIGTTTAIAVASGATLSMKGGTVADLNVAGTLAVGSDSTLSVTKTLTLSNSLNLNGTLAIGAQVSRIDLTGMTATNDGTTYSLIASGFGGSITGLPTDGSNLLSLLRVNGIGWTSASYADGVITLTRGGTMLTWDSNELTNWNADTEFNDGTETPAHAGTTSNVTFTAENAQLNLEANITLAGLDVDENKSLTLTTGTGEDAKSLSVSYINLEKNAALDASAITLKADNIDLSSGSVLTLGTVSGTTDGNAPIYTGNGTVKVGFGVDPGTVSMAEASVFVGTVNVTGGTVDLSGSAISQGTWKLDNEVNASLSGAVGNNIILDGTTHDFSVAQDGTATITSTIVGTGETDATAGLTKSGAGALTLSGTVDLTSMAVSEGSLTLSGAATLGSATVSATAEENGTAASLTLSGNTTVNTTLTNNGNLTLSGTTTVCTTTTDAETGKTTYSGSLENNGSLTFGASSHTTLNNFTNAGTVTFTSGSNLTVNGTLETNSDIGSIYSFYEQGGYTLVNYGSTFTFTGGENFVKSGTGGLVLYGTVNLSKTTISGGELQIVTDIAAQNFGELTLSGGDFLVFSKGAVNGYHVIDKLTVSSNDSKVKTEWNRVQLDICGLVYNGGDTLVLEDSHSSMTIAVYRFSGESSGSGTIDVKQTNTGSTRSVAISLAGSETLINSVVNFSESASDTANLGLAVSTDTAYIAGLENKDSTGATTSFGNRLNLISRGDASGNAHESDTTNRTLVITGDGTTHTFSGHVKGNLNLVMGYSTYTEDGSEQVFSGGVTEFNGNITVNSGTLSFTNTGDSGVLGAQVVTLSGGTLKLANDATFVTLSGVNGSSLLNTAHDADDGVIVKTLTLTGEGGTFAGAVSNFNIDLHEGAYGTHAFTGTLDGLGSVSVADGTLDLTTSASAGRTLELNTLTLSGGALVNGYKDNENNDANTSIGTITVTGTLTSTGGTLVNTNLVLDNSCTVNTGDNANKLLTSISNGSLTVNGSNTLTLASSAAMHLNNLTTSASIKLDTDVTVSDTIELTGNGEINFGNEKMLIYNGYTFTNLQLEEGALTNVGKLDVTYEGEGESQTKNVSATGLRVMRTSTGESEMAYQMENVKFVNGEGAGDTTLTATGNTFTDIVVAGGTLTIGAGTGVTTVYGDVTMTSPSATLTVAKGASLSNGVITLSGLNNGSLVIDNGETNASVFYGGGTEYSAANITNATVGIASGITGDGDPYVWGAQLVNSTLTTSGNVELFNTAEHSLYELTISSDTLRLNGNLTVQSQGDGATTATDGDITLGAGAKLIMENNGVLTNTLTNGTVITIAGKDTDDIDYDSTITNTTTDSVTLGALGAGLEIAYSIVTVNANGNTVNTAVTLDNSTLEVLGGTATASVETGSTNDFHALDGNMTVSVTTEGEQAAVANVGTLQVTGTEKTATFAKAGAEGTYAYINLQGDGSVIEAGNTVVAEKVTVKGATAAEGENPAVPGATLKVTASESDMAHVGGDLTVEGGGTLAVAGATANMPAVQVDNLLTLKEGAVLNLKDVAVTGETATIAVARANQVAGESGVLSTGDTISGLVVVTDASYHATNVYTGSASTRSTDTYVYADLEKNKITGYSIDGSGTLCLTTNISSGTDMSAYTDLSFVFETGVLAQLMHANLGDQVNVSLCYAGADGAQGAVIDIMNGATVSFNGYAGANAAATNAVWTANVGTYYVGEDIPEPTTGTLGVLALAALAARRRRRK